MVLRMILLASLPLLVFYVYDKLRYCRIEQFAAWPQLKSSAIWGHLTALHEFIVAGEPTRHIDIVFLEIKKHLRNPPLYVLDLRPVQYPLAVICSHEIAEQVSRSSTDLPYSPPKSPTTSALTPLLGPKSIITAYGEKWKGLRKRFNPGFAPQHLMSLLPCIMDKAWPFMEILDRYAESGEEFTLDGLCVNLTFDIIGAITMDEDLHAQLGKEKETELVQLYRKLTISYRTSSSTQWAWLQPRTLVYRWWLTRRIDVILSAHIKTKFAQLKAQPVSEKPEKAQKPRSVLSLSLQDVDQLDSNIIAQTRDQLKSFLFAGHDTTSILLQWAFYELSRTPRALAAIRSELDEIFGPNSSPGNVRDLLLSEKREDLVRRMSYTSAVIKEILRLYPPSGTARLVPYGTGFHVQLPDGNSLCLDGTVIYNCHTIIQRDEAVYGPTTDEFRPERWLGDTDTSMQTNVDMNESGGDAADSAKVPASAWRPFERGPRNCIGQELANLEARVILACMVRRYNFEKVGLGEIACDDADEPILSSNGQYQVKSELYNTMQVTAKPVDRMKVKVRLVPGASAL